MSYSAARKRKTFDQFGEEGLKGHGGGGVSYTFTTDPREIFSQFFGPGVNPFEGMMGGGSFSGPNGTTFGSFSSGMNGGGFMNFAQMAGGAGGFGGGAPSQQDPPVEHTVNLSLEELYSGCTKKMKISRKVSTANGSVTNENKIVSVDVRPGWKAGTKVTFPKEGDQVKGKIPSDIVFVIGEKPHPKFQREGNNLRHKAAISLKTALCGGTVEIPTIEGGTIRHPLKRVVGPSTEDTFQGRGMPLSKQPTKRGDLLVNYNISFPLAISDADKHQLSHVLTKYE